MPRTNTSDADDVFDVFFDLRPNNGWGNNREAGDLKRHRAHYDVTIMCQLCFLRKFHVNRADTA